jgi:hypothetical protein
MAYFRDISNEMSNLDETTYGRDMLAAFMKESVFFAWFEQMSAFKRQATDDSFNVYSGSGTVQNRLVGQDNVTVTPLVPSRDKVPTTLTFQGDAIGIDASHMADVKLKQGDAHVMLEEQMRRKMTDWTRQYEIESFQNDGTAGKFKGLNYLVNGTVDVGGQSGVKRCEDARNWVNLASKPDHLDMTNSDHVDAFLENMIRLWFKIKNANRAIVLNEDFFSRISMIAQKKWVIGEERSMFGVPIPTINRVPFLPLSSDVITNAEPDNASAENTTSMWFMAPEEFGLYFGTNSGLEVKEHDKDDTGKITKIGFEVRGNFTIEKPENIYRVKGFKLFN